MDWTTPLKAQQTDFIPRLKSAKLLHCDEKDQHSELTVTSGKRLDPTFRTSLCSISTSVISSRDKLNINT